MLLTLWNFYLSSDNLKPRKLFTVYNIGHIFSPFLRSIYCIFESYLFSSLHKRHTPITISTFIICYPVVTNIPNNDKQLWFTLGKLPQQIAQNV